MDLVANLIIANFPLFSPACLYILFALAFRHRSTIYCPAKSVGIEVAGHFYEHLFVRSGLLSLVDASGGQVATQ
jgi:hypothetical protein